jgi:hypothetical protein
MTIREIIINLQNEVAKSSDLLPERASEIMAQLSALLGNINDTIRERDMAYNKKLLEFLESEKQSSRAKIKAECSDEFNQKREARDSKELAIEMIRSLKFFLKAREDEFRAGKFNT